MKANEKLIIFALVILTLVGSTRAQINKSSDEPTEFIGSVEKNVYLNKYFGFQVTVPEGWQPVDSEDKQRAEKVARELFQQLNEAKGTNYVPPKFTTITLLYLRKKKLGEKGNSLFRIATTKQPHSKITPLMVAQASRLKVVENPVSANVSEIKETKISGKNFAYVEYDVISNPASILRNRHFVTVLREHSIGITISFHTDEEGKYLEGLVRSISFNESH